MGEIEGRGQRMVALCMLGCVLFNFPMLALFNVRGTFFGVPVLYAYIFLAWGTSRPDFFGNPRSRISRLNSFAPSAVSASSPFLTQSTA